MANDGFIVALAIVLGAALAWGFKTLPDERWQVLASVPRERTDEGWRGLNLTYYGALTATATMVAATLLVVLLGAVGVPAVGAVLLLTAVMFVGGPAAKLVARRVEGKGGTFTIGGASFLGLLFAPAILWVGASWGTDHLTIAPGLAALVIAYAIGEGLGRLACISFGCCYGRALRRAHPAVRALFARWHFVFTGASKKAAYEGGLEREPVVPIQAITAVMYTAAGLIGLWLFMRSAFVTAFVAVCLATQLWRALSETLRVDHRGGGRISVYQVMAIAAALYAVAIGAILPASRLDRPDIVAGVTALWSPGVILVLQATWLGVFLYMGRSVVTASHIAIYVVKDRV